MYLNEIDEAFKKADDAMGNGRADIATYWMLRGLLLNLREKEAAAKPVALTAPPVEAQLEQPPEKKSKRKNSEATESL
jgi:hypothetical protein